jgi:hypothetical protein
MLQNIYYTLADLGEIFISFAILLLIAQLPYYCDNISLYKSIYSSSNFAILRGLLPLSIYILLRSVSSSAVPKSERRTITGKRKK